MADRWYRNAVVYSLDVHTFQDSDDDGVGDLVGLTERLDYLARLGATALWLNPVHPSPGRDGGYDITDHYEVDPAIGTLGDFAELLNQADSRGMRVVLDLVVNHTSSEHPWFRSASTDPDSPYRDFYVWSDTEPPARHEGMVFPGVQTETWTYAEGVGRWYHHRFYDFEPDLNIENPVVRREILKIAAFWVRLGVAGFRIDAAPFVVELTRPDRADGEHDHDFYTELRQHLSWRRGDVLLLAEANVPEEEQLRYFSSGGSEADRIQMLFSFDLDAAAMVSLARQDATAVEDALRAVPQLPRHGQWATFLRNHDEVDLSTLPEDARRDVFAAFGPDPDMQVYGRGIRRRLAPMLGGDRRRLEMAYSLQFALPGTPVLRYGDEIGMGEDLALPQREAIRTPMQWSGGPGAGFSRSEHLVKPLVSDEEFAPDRVNVADQRRDPASLLQWFERMLHTLRECAEIGTGRHEVVELGDGAPRSVLAHRARGASGDIVFLHNLADEPAAVDLSALGETAVEVLGADGAGQGSTVELAEVALGGYGYRWLRLSGLLG
ncbi:maltose alpha-D-glucosyltransferase/alpha-amylase [Motilibacter rhizosphaerae]|uniref:Maltose alpha-D-glucosyltransferase/alpha-amylase n=1 Tax=Motilibacter rhizosphaerae TaxID=598652 RepID=A0A4Q7NPX6_9ACTN|nr:alpha-amylase family protein [Motilibacter rhizosphaerae]RZS87152.1 maltose alpha-D-glucosyltransferase/alpha-amylase [Motilibacter rhizosphaerae]